MEKEIRAALDTLQLEPPVSIRRIKRQYKRLLHQWHPDRSRDKSDAGQAKTVELTTAYKRLLEYCENYPIPFAEDKQGEDAEQFWQRRFGNDPVWGNND